MYMRWILFFLLFLYFHLFSSFLKHSLFPSRIKKLFLLVCQLCECVSRCLKIRCVFFIKGIKMLKLWSQFYFVSLLISTSLLQFLFDLQLLCKNLFLCIFREYLLLCWLHSAYKFVFMLIGWLIRIYYHNLLKFLWASFLLN